MQHGNSSFYSCWATRVIPIQINTCAVSIDAGIRQAITYIYDALKIYAMRISLIFRVIDQVGGAGRGTIRGPGATKVGWWLGVILCAGLVGCDSLTIVSVDRLTAPGLDELFPHASMANITGDYQRLNYDIPRAMKASHWGMLSLTHEPAGSARARHSVLRAAALLPDGRTATIVAWSKNERVVSVAVRVGNLGDGEREKDFLAQLGSVLRGKPSRTHRFDQTLPKL